jgi:hypothetical protein
MRDGDLADQLAALVDARPGFHHDGTRWLGSMSGFYLAVRVSAEVFRGGQKAPLLTFPNFVPDDTNMKQRRKSMKLFPRKQTPLWTEGRPLLPTKYKHPT